MYSYFDAMRRYASFSGRSNRAQIWRFSLVYWLLVIAAIAFHLAMGGEFADIKDNMPPLLSLIIIVHFIPSIAVTARRLHDVDRSGWWTLLTLLPGIGWLIWLFYALDRPSFWTNRFGPPVDDRPKTTKAQPTITVAVAPKVNLEKLERLAALRASGAIDEVEFQSMKADIMGGAI